MLVHFTDLFCNESSPIRKFCWYSNQFLSSLKCNATILTSPLLLFAAKFRGTIPYSLLIQSLSFCWNVLRQDMRSVLQLLEWAAVLAVVLQMPARSVLILALLVQWTASSCDPEQLSVCTGCCAMLFSSHECDPADVFRIKVNGNGILGAMVRHL